MKFCEQKSKKKQKQVINFTLLINDIKKRRRKLNILSKKYWSVKKLKRGQKSYISKGVELHLIHNILQIHFFTIELHNKKNYIDYKNINKKKLRRNKNNFFGG